jgi:hypothetical protein|nr:MAG TPA: hypothetical protein [Caudoviricetes sp.]
MKISGIGIVSQKEVKKVLTKEAVQMIKSGEMTWEEAAEIYKLQQVKKFSKIGKFSDTFAVNYNRIPESIKEKLTPEELADLTDAFYNCYGEGKNSKEE